MRHALAILLLSGCAFLRPMVASNDDLADYRSYAIAHGDGPRLAAAQRYLAAHPKGQWSTEVRAMFDVEEPAYYDRAKESRAGALEYIGYLPQGPHADQATAALGAFDKHIADDEAAREIQAAQQTESSLAKASEARRVYLDWVTTALAVTAGAKVGAPVMESSDLLRVVAGTSPSTWGGVPTRYAQEHSFLTPARPTALLRASVTTLYLSMTATGVLERVTFEGPFFFERWAEAELLRPLDPSVREDLAAIEKHARDIVTGMLEARMPAGRCDKPPPAGDFLYRECDGLLARASVDRESFVVESAP